MQYVSLYYLLKPLLPRPLQIHVRRFFARQRRRAYADSWPILQGAGTPPPAWGGWPDGRKFALALTHDVEGPCGLERCRRLMELEERHGFRSVLNFIPERRYTVPAGLREEITRRGFEVGVHGLYHDGRDFQSRRHFDRRAPEMNRYLHAWEAVGFRAPSTVHNLDWIRDLDIEYDSSTFDTDPFEPKPDGVGTIFPFRVSRRDGLPDYVELPYTIPQDFTLFVMLGERNIEVWKQKLDWIAAQGGLALLDTHPDYMCFDGEPHSREEYPVRFYEEFLEYARSKYGESYWHALPRDVARHCAGAKSGTRRRTLRRACMLAYAFYDSDNRIMRYAETLSARGDDVDVIGLRREGQPRYSILNNVHVYRIQERKRDEKGKLAYLARLLRFFFRSSLFLAHKNLRTRYELVHVHSVPDFEVFAAWAPRLSGARIILDIHDLVPEFYTSKFGVDQSDFAYKLLLWIERASTAFADHVIIANHIWHERITARSVPPGKCSAILNYVDPDLFHPDVHPPARDGEVRVVYPGGLQWHQGLDIAIRAFARVHAEIPRSRFLIYGEGSEKPKLQRLAEELGLKDCVLFEECVPVRQIAGILAQASLGVVAKRADSFGNEAYSTKILEYMSQGVPVVVSRTKIDTHYFDDSEVRFFSSGSAEEMAEAMLDVLRNPALRNRLIENGRKVVEQNSWSVKKQEYLDLVDGLVAGKTSPP